MSPWNDVKAIETQPGTDRGRPREAKRTHQLCSVKHVLTCLCYLFFSPSDALSSVKRTVITAKEFLNEFQNLQLFAELTEITNNVDFFFNEFSAGLCI